MYGPKKAPLKHTHTQKLSSVTRILHTIAYRPQQMDPFPFEVTRAALTVETDYRLALSLDLLLDFARCGSTSLAFSYDRHERSVYQRGLRYPREDTGQEGA